MATLEKPRPVVATALPLPSLGWLRSPSFDSLFIGGIAAIALAATALVTRNPDLFAMLLVIDMWLLGFQHVVATFTRLTFDTDSFRTYRFLVVWLPMIVLAGVFGLVLAFGGWVLPTLYLYWQWFHYTRQSYGIAQIYRRKAGGLGEEPPLLTKAAIYLLPLWGILHRSWQEPSTFLSMKVKTLPVPLLVVRVAAVAAVAALAWWLWRQIVALFQRRLPVAYTLYMLSHVAIFAFGYLIVDNLDHGWLTINIWHNAQYILLVWMYNNNRFKGGVDPHHRFLSAISQPEMAATYFLVCVGISTVFYLGLNKVVSLWGLSVLPVTLIAYQTINFHHYIVDGIIWKVRKPAVRENLGVAG
jgi:hypothetical protein